MHTAKVISLVQQPSAAEVALAGIRANFGRNGAASRWSRLSVKQRAIVCYAAGLSPEQCKTMELDQLDFDQQEAIRLALGDLQAMLEEFGGTVLHRREWHRPCRQEGSTRTEQEQAAQEHKQRALLNEQAGTLESRIAVMKRTAGNGQ